MKLKNYVDLESWINSVSLYIIDRAKKYIQKIHVSVFLSKKNQLVLFKLWNLVRRCSMNLIAR